MNNSYLQTLKNLQKDHNNSKIVQIASQYSNYEQFLRRRPQTKTYDKTYDFTKYCVNEGIGQTVKYSPQSQISSTAYYPVERTQIQYKDYEYIEKVPIKKKVVEYAQKKQIQLVPKQVVKTQYYAVQHLRHYQKLIVPQKRVEMIKVPKTVKKVDYVPQQKQIIYYPNHLSGDNQIKQAAKQHLQKLGVVIQQNAQYKSISLKKDNVEPYKSSTPLKYYQQNLSENISYPTFRENSYTKEANSQYISLPRRKYHDKVIPESRKIPTYQKQNYETDLYSSSKPEKDVFTKGFYEPEEYSFAQKDLYRYNMAVNSSLSY